MKTIKLQEMLLKAIKGVGDNKLIPLTSMLQIKSNSEGLTLTTTNATNYLYILDKGNYEDMSIVVNADQFVKLISKLTSEEVELKVIGNVLQVTADKGVYNIDLQFDEGGRSIQFPDNRFDGKNGKILKLSTVRSVINACKPALATTMEMPVYTGYYLGESAIATDTYVISEYKSNIFDNPVLLGADLVDLLDLFTEEDINVYFEDDKVMFDTNDCIVVGRVMQGIEDYAIQPITNLLNQYFESSCKVNKGQLLSALDRVSLFVGRYDNNAIKLTFDEGGLIIESKLSNGIEHIDYAGTNNLKHFSCLINVFTFMEQIKANSSDIIMIDYGLDNAIRLSDTNTTQIISLLEE